MPPPDESLSTALADRYRLDGEIGVGGSATVYSAYDLKNRRQVALKVLHRDVARAFGPERFQREIETTANLRHPNILPLFDSGEAGDALYYVMPLVDGESLRSLISRTGQFALVDALRLVADIAGALTHAHERGIVHRDIKPENVLIENGRAVVSDFGIARASSAIGHERLTSTGMSLGTPHYMSPEQAFAEDQVDARSDQYSLSCVLYEMLAGAPPFDGTTAMAILLKQLQQPVPSLREARPDVPEQIAHAIERALSKSPEDRYASIAEWLGALIATDAPTAAGAGAAIAYRAASPPAAPATATRIAVLPFTNMSNDPDAEFFGDGMAEEILNELSKLSGLRMIARTSSFALKGERADVTSVGARLGARYVLDGSIRKAGSRIRITVQLGDAEAGDTIWSERYDRDMTDVFAVQDEITAAVRDALSERLLGISIPAPRTALDIDHETYELFLRGKYDIAHHIEDPRRGIELIEEVIRRAPRYAPALVQLAVAHKMRVIYGAATPAHGWPLVRELCERAVAVDPRFAAALFNLADTAFYWEWDWPKAKSLFDDALALDGSNADVLVSYAMFKCSTREFESALQLVERAVGLDPLNPTILLRAAIARYIARKYDQAIATCERLKELVPEFAEGHRWKGLSLLALGRTHEALPELERSVTLSQRNVWSVFNLGRALAAAGRMDEARILAAELSARSRKEPFTSFVLTLEPQLADPPDMAQLFELLQRAVLVERSFWVVMFGVEPIVDWLRGDPRFGALLRAAGFPVT